MGGSRLTSHNVGSAVGFEPVRASLLKPVEKLTTLETNWLIDSVSLLGTNNALHIICTKTLWIMRYSFSNNHGSVENGPSWRLFPKLIFRLSPIFHWTMIVGRRVKPTLIGGWTNPFENGNLPQSSGWKFQKCLQPPPSIKLISRISEINNTQLLILYPLRKTTPSCYTTDVQLTLAQGFVITLGMIFSKGLNVISKTLATKIHAVHICMP